MTAWAVTFDEPQPYAAMVRTQERLVAAREADRIPDTVLFLEHRPVVTLGTRGRMGSLLASPEALAARGIELAHASRGGDVTFHGPGQLVIYPILRLGSHECDAHGYLWNLEETAIATAARFGVKAWRRDGKNGAWTEQGKLAAIGFRLKRWITMHGMSFNVAPDMVGFDTIIPCGLKGESVTSLQAILGARCPSLADAREAMRSVFESVFDRPLNLATSRGGLPPAIAECLA